MAVMVMFVETEEERGERREREPKGIQNKKVRYRYS
jgi:hypothetical protein